MHPIYNVSECDVTPEWWGISQKRISQGYLNSLVWKAERRRKEELLRIWSWASNVVRLSAVDEVPLTPKHKWGPSFLWGIHTTRFKSSITPILFILIIMSFSFLQYIYIIYKNYNPVLNYIAKIFTAIDEREDLPCMVIWALPKL